MLQVSKSGHALPTPRAGDHNSDKQSHDVCVNCNTQLLQLPFKIEYHCTDKEIGSQRDWVEVEMQVA